MIGLNRNIFCVIAAVATCAVAFSAAPAAPAPKPRPPAAKPVKVKTDTRVYLLRGLLNVFSLGMDALQERLTAMGFEAEVYNHNGWISIANKIVEDRKRGDTGAVVLIGHSLGADVMFELTQRLDKENIPVRLAVFFDPTTSQDISKNVEHVLNLYQLNGFGRRVTAPKGYKGELTNMDLSGDETIGHGSIDKSQKLHDLVVEKIMKVAVGPVKRRRVPSKPKPVATVPSTPAAHQPALTGSVPATPKVEAAPAARQETSASPPPSANAAPAVQAPAASAPAAPAPAASAPAPSGPAQAAPKQSAPPAEAAQVPRI